MNKLIQFLRESRDEVIHKVTWPTWKQLQRDSAIVLVSSLIFSLMIWGMDYVFRNLMELIYDL